MVHAQLVNGSYLGQRAAELIEEERNSYPMTVLNIKEKLCLTCFFALTSIWFAIAHRLKSYLIWNSIDFIHHQVGLPFGARFLIYDLAGLLSNCLNADLFAKIVRGLFMTDAVFMFLVLVLMFLFVVRTLGSKVLAFLSTVLLSYILFFHYVVTPIHNYLYLYDMAATAFMMVFIYAARYRNNIGLLVLCVFVATLNRETAFLMPVVYLVLWYKNMPTRSLLLRLSLLSLSWLVAKVLIHVYMSSLNISGDILSLVGDNELRLIRNIKIIFFLQPLNSLAFYSTFGFLWVPMLFFGKIFVHRFSYFSYVILFYFLLMLFVGNIDEIRIYNECIILFILMAMAKLQLVLESRNISLP